RAIGPVTIRKDGSADRPYGKYQVMGSNIGDWTEDALGQRLTPTQFLMNDKAQDLVFRHRFGQYVDQYGEERAARAWFGGPGGVNRPNRRDVLGTSVGVYGQDSMSRLGRRAEGDPGTMLASATTGTMTDAPPITPRIPGLPEQPEETPTDIRPPPTPVRTQIAQAPPGLIPGSVAGVPGLPSPPPPAAAPAR